MAQKTLKAKGDSTVAGAQPLEADISGVAAGENVDILIRIHSLSSGEKIQIAVEDTVNDFAASEVIWSRGFEGGLTQQGPVDWLIKRRDIPLARFGTANAELRLNLQQISGGTLNWEAFIVDQKGNIVVA